MHRDGLAVLVVEDEALISMTLADHLTDLGHRVTAEVATTAAAMAEIQDRAPDLVLLDMNLSGELSSEVAHHCTALGVPVILTTGYDEGAIPEDLSHCPYLAKPFGLDELKAAIEKVMSR